MATLKVEQLRPTPTQRVQFSWSHAASVPATAGCYVLATFAGDVLYVGLATTSIRARMENHLDSPDKRKGSELGVPFWFFYMTCSPKGVQAVERGWMNQSILAVGDLPPLNDVYSPV